MKAPTLEKNYNIKQNNLTNIVNYFFFFMNNYTNGVILRKLVKRVEAADYETLIFYNLPFVHYIKVPLFLLLFFMFAIPHEYVSLTY